MRIELFVVIIFIFLNPTTNARNTTLALSQVTCQVTRCGYVLTWVYINKNGANEKKCDRYPLPSDGSPFQCVNLNREIKYETHRFAIAPGSSCSFYEATSCTGDPLLVEGIGREIQVGPYLSAQCFNTTRCPNLETSRTGNKLLL